MDKPQQSERRLIVMTSGRPFAPAVDWEIFEGRVHAAELVGADSSQIRVYDVTFRTGARTAWHSHTVDQLLVITAGHGIVATEEEEREVRTGDLVVIPAELRHWHGAMDDAEMTHLAIMNEGEDVL